MRADLRISYLIFGLSIGGLPGCMQTRYAESSHYWNVGSGCPGGSEQHSTHRERHWTGFWLGQPDQIRP